MKDSSPNPELSKPSIVEDFVHFLRFDKKWLLGFLAVTLALLSALIFMAEKGGTHLPIIYEIF